MHVPRIHESMHLRIVRCCSVHRQSKRPVVEFVLPHSLAAGLAVRYQPRVWPQPGRPRSGCALGLLRYPACPRTYGLASSAGGKGSPQAVTQLPRHAISNPTYGAVSVTKQCHQHPPHGSHSQTRNPTSPAPQAAAIGPQQLMRDRIAPSSRGP